MGEQVELLGEQGFRIVKSKTLLFAGTKGTKECVRNERLPVGKQLVRVLGLLGELS